MKPSLAGLSLALVGLLFVPLAEADSIYTFSIGLTSGTDTGTVTGTLDLPFVSPGGSGSGAASSLVFTSIPAGFGSLAGGDTATAWADQVDNLFTVSSGAITSFDFFATTGSADPADVICMNSTGAGTTFGAYTCVAGLNELDGPTSDIFGYNFGGLEGVTFSSPVSSGVPEPGTSSLMLVGVGLMVVMRKRICQRFMSQEFPV
jgi:hypothetical protein